MSRSRNRSYAQLNIDRYVRHQIDNVIALVKMVLYVRLPQILARNALQPLYFLILHKAQLSRTLAKWLSVATHRIMGMQERALNKCDRWCDFEKTQ